MGTVTTRFACALALFAVAVPAAAASKAKAPVNYPIHPIHVVVPAPPGNSLDLVARIVARGLSEELGQAVVVENRPGAATNVGNAYVAKAKADGYTLLFGAATLAINPSVYAHLTYDPQRDLEPIALATRINNVVVVSASTPVRNIAELIDWCRANPGKLNFVSPGVGTSVHLGGEVFKSMTGVDIVHVPFKTTSDGLASILAGDSHMAFENLPYVLPFIQAGKFRALAVTSSHRSTLLPDVPTMAESGLRGYDVSTWFGLLAPAGTPPAIVQRLEAAAHRAMALPDVRRALADAGAEIADEGSASFRALLRHDTERWSEVVREAHVIAN